MPYRYIYKYYKEGKPTLHAGTPIHHPANRRRRSQTHDIATTHGMHYVVSTKEGIRSCFESKHLADGTPSTVDHDARSVFERSTR